jgi:hypothetical protein
MNEHNQYFTEGTSMEDGMLRNHSRPCSWLMLLLLFGFMIGSTPATTAQIIEPEPDWLAVAISVDFSVSPARFGHTVYAGKNDPATQTATILDWEHTDMTSSCTFHGVFSAPDANGYQRFDGTTNYIECDTPGIASEWLDMYPDVPLESHLTCDGGSPLFASTDGKLSPGTRPNPIITTSNLGINYYLPRQLNQARSQFRMGSATYSSNWWLPSTSNNQVLIAAWNGPAIIAADSQFNWMNYLDPAWEAGIRPVSGYSARHWYQSPNNLTSMASIGAYTLNTLPQTVYFGYDPATNNYFKGSLRKAIVDPGCPAS